MGTHEITINVGGEPLQIAKLGHRRAKGWRKSFEQALVSLAPKLVVVDPDSLRKVDLTKTDQLESLFQKLFGLVEEALDTSLALVLQYCEDGLKGKEAVEDAIYDEEIVSNFIVVIRAAIPFESLMTLFRTLNSGQPDQTTTTSLPSQNGVSSTTTDLPTSG